jgi:hypothetical protein
MTQYYHLFDSQDLPIMPVGSMVNYRVILSHISFFSGEDNSFNSRKY